MRAPSRGRGRRGTLAAAAASGVLLLTGCTPGKAAFSPCPDVVTEVAIFNTYAGHDAADRHDLIGDAALALCETAFPYDTLPTRTHRPGELGERRITVFRFADAAGGHRTLWVYGLAGHEAGTALLLDDGSSFHVPNQGPAGYHSPEVQRVLRSEVPRPG